MCVCMYIYIYIYTHIHTYHTRGGSRIALSHLAFFLFVGGVGASAFHTVGFRCFGGGFQGFVRVSNA